MCTQHDTEGLAYCEECDWKGDTEKCSINGDSDGEHIWTWLECPTEGCTGHPIEL